MFGSSRAIDKNYQKIKDFALFFDDIIKLPRTNCCKWSLKTTKAPGKHSFSL